jgi:hypothetical protein
MIHQTDIKTQIAAIKKVGLRVRKTKKTALKFLIDAGIIKSKK